VSHPWIPLIALGRQHRAQAPSPHDPKPRRNISGSLRVLATVAIGVPLAACEADRPDPTAPSAGLTASIWGPETPPFNLQVVLRGADHGFGLVKFRQPNDADKIVYLDVWVRDLTPNSGYRLQRAVDPTPDDDCTSQAWLTLGKGLTPELISTDDQGTGRAELYRDLATIPTGMPFDIHFRVIEDGTGAVALTSECYQFVVDP